MQVYFIEHANHHLDNAISDNQITVVHFPDALEPLVSEEIKVIPNPFRDFISVQIQGEDVELILFDTFGRRLSQGQNSLSNLDILPPGIYTLTCFSADYSKSTRILKAE